MGKRAYRLYTWLVYTVLWGMVWAYPVLEETMNVMQSDHISRRPMTFRSNRKRKIILSFYSRSILCTAFLASERRICIDFEGDGQGAPDEPHRYKVCTLSMLERLPKLAATEYCVQQRSHYRSGV